MDIDFKNPFAGAWKRIQHEVFPECSHVIRAETGNAADMAHEAGVECIDLGHGHNLSGGVLSERAEDADDACGGEDVKVVGEGLAFLFLPYPDGEDGV